MRCCAPATAHARRTGTRRPALSQAYDGSVRFLPSPCPNGALRHQRSGGGWTMARSTRWSSMATAAAVLVIAGACNDSQSPKPRALLGLPDVGTIAVTVTTSGSNAPGGYTVSVDGSSQSVGANGLATFIGLPPGSHTVRLSGVPANCSVGGDNPRSVSLIAGLVAATTFSVSCSAPPPPPTTGDLTVTTSTSGSNLDADGYTLTLDGGATRSIGVNGSVTFSGVSAGGPPRLPSGGAGEPPGDRRGPPPRGERPGRHPPHTPPG